MVQLSKLISKLKNNSATYDDIINTSKIADYIVCDESICELLNIFGLPVDKNEDIFFLRTSITDILSQEFCFVDIETNGSNPSKSQIIEIAAVKTKGIEVIDKFETLVFCDSVSDMISGITGINVDKLVDKPSEKDVLYDFRLFIGCAVFVAHNADFDYGFISESMKKYDIPPLYNRKLCTIELAKRTIKAEKYGLKYLAELLKLDDFLHHRAYSDAYASYEIFKKSLENLPFSVNTTEDLIDFSKTKI